MITREQERQIAQYLILKKLYSGLFVEIKDHFIMQIFDMMEENNENFQEAFLQTKLNWKHELEMIKADHFSFKKITRIEKKILQTRFRNIMVLSLVTSILLSGFLLVNSELFTYIQVLLSGVLVCLISYSFIFKKMHFSAFVQLSFHPLIMKNTFVYLMTFSLLYLYYDKFEFTDFAIIKVFFLYGIITQIQLLYWNSRKINVLI